MNHHYDYQAARARFLALAEPLMSSMETHTHPLLGPDGETATDIAWFGNPDAEYVLVLSSGTHGVEGYCGSFIQCQLLDDGLVERLPENLSLVMIHGVNPHGFAWRRRVNEDNIDLNRNFVDHGSAKTNEGYEEIAAALEPKEWNEIAINQMWQDIFAAAANHEEDPGWQGMAITSGQTAYPNGVFYAGIKPAWSNEKMRTFAQSLFGKKVMWLDIHTALGPYGDAECIVEYAADTKPLVAANALWGDRVKNTKTNDSHSADIAGSMGVGAHEALGDDLVFAGLEYGTVKPKQVLEAVIGDQWLHRFGDLESDLGCQLKQNMMDSFYPDDPKWRDSVYKIAVEMIEPTLKAAS